MQALMAIALLCQVSTCGLFCSVEDAQLKCQKALIACYEGKFPKPPPSEDAWVGALKDCVKERVLE